MIPLGSDHSPRLVIGHNVGYDRVRLGEEYRLARSGTRYLDTMALHIAGAGMTSQQVNTADQESDYHCLIIETHLELLQEPQ